MVGDINESGSVSSLSISIVLNMPMIFWGSNTLKFNQFDTVLKYNSNS